MIHLDQGQEVAEHPELVVCDPTGEYNDSDMVLCAKRETPNEPYCRYEAEYIAYGGVVYSISDDAALLAEIQRVDPDTTLNQTVADSPVSTDAVPVPASEPAQAAPQADTTTSAPSVDAPADTGSQTPADVSDTPAPAPDPAPAVPSAGTPASDAPISMNTRKSRRRIA